jgi:hypothetical protein
MNFPAICDFITAVSTLRRRRTGTRRLIGKPRAEGIHLRPSSSIFAASVTGLTVTNGDPTSNLVRFGAN